MRVESDPSLPPALIGDRRAPAPGAAEPAHQCGEVHLRRRDRRRSRAVRPHADLRDGRMGRRDTGIGIAPSAGRHTVHRFRPGGRLDHSPLSAAPASASRSASASSTQMGGTITLSSTPGRRLDIPRRHGVAVGGRRSPRRAQRRRLDRRPQGPHRPSRTPAARADRRGQSDQPAGRHQDAQGRSTSPPISPPTGWRRSQAVERFAVRRHLHGHAHAGDGRAGGDARHPQPAATRCGRRADHRAHRQRLRRRHQGVPRGGHERFRRQAGPQARAGRGDPARAAARSGRERGAACGAGAAHELPAPARTPAARIRPRADRVPSGRTCRWSISTPSTACRPRSGSTACARRWPCFSRKPPNGSHACATCRAAPIAASIETEAHTLKGRVGHVRPASTSRRSRARWSRAPARRLERGRLPGRRRKPRSRRSALAPANDPSDSRTPPEAGMRPAPGEPLMPATRALTTRPSALSVMAPVQPRSFAAEMLRRHRPVVCK